MTRAGGSNNKLTKLKSVLKKLNSFNYTKHQNNNNTTSTITAVAATPDEYEVYVGRSRRKYLLSSFVIDHPLFNQLAQKSSHDDSITVSCEVVLFEHLLWMLENADPQPESLQELVEFYAC